MDIVYHDLDDYKAFGVTNVNLPSICNHCNVGVDFIIKEIIFSKITKDYSFFVFCPVCKKSSLIVYNATHKIYVTYPLATYHYNLNAEIKSFSPDFITIYTEAMQAYINGQNSIAGMGFRKALEFLVFDFLIKIQGETLTDKTTLSDGIKLLNIPLKNTAKLASWIGNDQTHYFIKNPGFTTDDLIKYIKSIANHLAAIVIDNGAEELAKK